ncbi:xanthine dehydrogenase accessory protein XdhC, partial [Pseudomonas sp. HMWF010]
MRGCQGARGRVVSNWARAALARIAANDTAALVTVLATEGSAPREAGTK